MTRVPLLLLVTLSACAGKQPLLVDCERRLVPINEPIEQSKDPGLEDQEHVEGHRP